MYNKINEKIHWRSILLALGVTYMGVSKWPEYKLVRDIYDVVNSESSLPRKGEREYIEKIRGEVIDLVKDSRLFNRFNKQYILDSLRSIQFKVVDSTIIFSKDAKASYIYIKPLKGKFKYLLSEVPTGENFIILNRKDLIDPDYPSTIVHELYHYLDRLIEYGNSSYSNQVDMSNYIDKKLDDKAYVKKKIMSLMFFANKKSKTENRFADLIYDDYKSSEKYYKSNSELFARYKTLKYDLLKAGVIKNINQTITIEDLANYLYNQKSEKQLEHVYLLISIDLNKLKELDSLI